jgi:group I intron endonuclease
MNVLSHSNAEYGTIEVYEKPPRVLVTHREHGRNQIRSCDMPSISRTPSIYQIRHVESGRVYVGSTVNPRKRWGEHIRELRGGTHHSSYLQHAWDKHGEEAFMFEVIEPVLFVELLIEREQYWIRALCAAERSHGYNVLPAAGSPLGAKRTDEERAKMSERSKTQFSDPAQRAKASVAQKKRFTDPEERARRSEQATAQFVDPSARARHSERAKAAFADPAARIRQSQRATAQFADPEERAKMSERAKAQFADPAQRAKASAAQKKRFASPEERAKLSERIKLRLADPVHRARLLEAAAKGREAARKRKHSA